MYFASLTSFLIYRCHWCVVRHGLGGIFEKNNFFAHSETMWATFLLLLFSPHPTHRNLIFARLIPRLSLKLNSMLKLKLFCGPNFVLLSTISTFIAILFTFLFCQDPSISFWLLSFSKYIQKYKTWNKEQHSWIWRILYTSVIHFSILFLSRSIIDPFHMRSTPFQSIV